MEKTKAFFKETFETLFFALAIALLIRAFLFQIFWIPSASMEPTFDIKDRLIVGRIVLGVQNPLYDMNDSPTFLFNIPNPLYNTKFPLSNVRYIWKYNNLKRLDVVVFKYPKDPIGTRRDFIKRLIGLPGDTVEIKNGFVFINGNMLEEKHSMFRDEFNMPKTTVPADSYFFMGDNRGNSADSRYWGFATDENIIGPALFKIWPLNKIGPVHNN